MTLQNQYEQAENQGQSKKNNFKCLIKHRLFFLYTVLVFEMFIIVSFHAVDTIQQSFTQQHSITILIIPIDSSKLTWVLFVKGLVEGI